jgi:hypothetical protein
MIRAESVSRSQLGTILNTNPAPFLLTNRKDGAGDRDRTGDIQLGKLAFYR